MNWEATVMNDGTKRQFRLLLAKVSRSFSKWDIEGMLQAQAKLTGEVAEKAGMIKVVEWVNKTGIIDDFRMEDWQAQLKQWGLGK